MNNNIWATTSNVGELKVDNIISAPDYPIDNIWVSGNKTTLNASTKEQKDHYEIKMEVHGVEDVQISYEKLIGLIVKGSKETLNGRKDVKNTFKINEDVYDLEKLSASIHKGILTICIGKREEYKEKVLCTLKNEESIVLSDQRNSKITYSNGKTINGTIKKFSI